VDTCTECERLEKNVHYAEMLELQLANRAFGGSINDPENLELKKQSGAATAGAVRATQELATHRLSHRKSLNTQS